MKRNVLVTNFICSSMLLSTLAMTQTVNAETTYDTTGSEKGNQATSKMHVKITGFDPDDPNNKPTKPLVPGVDPGGETGNVGELTIDYITPLYFGEHVIPSSKTSYETIAKSPNLQVTDRRGSGQGWSLSVSSSVFADINNPKKILKGVTVCLPEGNVFSEDNVSMMPKTRAAILATDASSANGTSGQNSAIVFQANKGTGLGTWVSEMKAKDIKITVPSGNAAGEYTANLEWVLSDAPR